MTDPRTATLENALKALGINPDDDPMYYAKRWIEGRDSDRRERDQALTERDNATARVSARELRIADLKRDLACKADAIKTAIGALDRICEVIGAPAPVSPETVVEAVTTLLGASEYAEARAETAERALKDVGTALDDAGAPMLYTGMEDPNGVAIPYAERVRLLGERARGEHAERIREGNNVQVYRDRLAAAERALDDRDAPRFADGAPLSPAARIRALPR